MFKTMKKRIKNEKGLTLIELLAVIVILAIVAAIAIPAIGNIIAKQNDKAVLSDATTIINGAKIAITDGACENTTAGAAGATTPTITCSFDDLQPYVEGITLVTGDQVVKSDLNASNPTYTLTWDEGADHDFTRVGTALNFATGATEANILAQMNE